MEGDAREERPEKEISMKFTLNIEGTTEELRDALVTLDKAGKDVDGARRKPEEPKPDQEPEREPEVEKQAPAPTLDEIRKAMMRAIDAGKRQQCSETLQAHGAKRVTELPEGERAAFLAEIEAL